jgi:hypothetical protein
MAKRKSTTITFPQLQAVIESLKTKYPVALAEVDSKRILCLKCDGNSKRVARLSSIKVPHPSVTPFRFALTIYVVYDELDEARQVLHILRELLRIEDFEGGKMCKYPLQDFPEIVEKYGTTWEENDALENPLEEKKPGE